LGNQPLWVSHWLEKNNIDAYYFAGDTGMGPTQVYRDSRRDGNNIWAFPIVHLGRYASLEEMGFANVDPAEVRDWLSSVADFAASDRSARLIYTHPLGATKYIAALRQFLDHTDQLSRQQRFRWYTMAGLADFLNQRKSVTWSLAPNAPNSLMLEGRSAETLNHETWVLPQGQFNQPQVRRGKALVNSDGDHWLIDAGDCRELEVEITRKHEL
jgi:hypothetical protein